ncbi:diguanylate cyclase [Salinicola avicenniae]|uniref:diguanylate cyclase n=1 Tax=Salinicola avicenniae TaxID=2916836 RepID=UPI002072A90E|nr:MULTISPECIES: diguanylate cyclase [unclassified Salinicola]
MSASDIETRLAELKQQYVLRLRNDLQTLIAQTRVMSTREGVIEVGALESVRQGLHRIAGSAGSFGYPEVGRDAREMEVWLQTLIEARGVPAPSMLGALHERLRDVHRLLDASPATVVREPESGYRAESGDRAVRVGLLVDAERESLTQALAGFGYECRALPQDATSTWQPDVIIVDTAGQYATSWQPIAEQSRHAVRVLLSDSGDFAARLQAVRDGAQGFFTHPLDIPALERRLRHLVSLPQQDPYRVLLIDDDEALAEHYRLTLKRAGIESRVVIEPADVLTGMRDFVPDLVLIDINMPDCSGPELARVIRLDDDWLRVPLIYLSAEHDANRQAQALAQAGDDFLVKPISDVSLVAAVTARAQRSRQLSLALARDGLTGLIKHPAIKDLIEIEQSRSQRTGASACVVMIDIDRFKSVNDTYGHGTGDYVIRLLANLLRQRLRRVDHVGRYGGEEFVAVLPSCSLADAHEAIERIRVSFSQLECIAGDQIFQATFSAGIASTLDWTDAEALLEAADKAMYEAKQGGRNQVCLARPEA